MKIYISVDMEGIAGVVTPQQVGAKGKVEEMAAKLMAGETNAAIEGAFEAGATEVVVNDSHGDMTNLLPLDIDSRALLVSGPTKRYEMMEGIDDSFAGAIFVGYHARSRSPGVMSHTFYGSVVSQLTINGQVVGETGLNGGIAGAFGVPVIMVAGDASLAAEATALIPGVEAVTVKYPAGAHAAMNLSPEMARQRVREGARAAVERASQISPVRFAEPTTFELTFMRVVMADTAEMIPNTRRTGEITVAYTGKDYLEAFRCFVAMAVLGSSTVK